MTSKTDGFERRFIILGQSWYADACLKNRTPVDYFDSIEFGYYHPDGGTSGEASVKFYDLQGVAPRVEVFNDAFWLFEACADLFTALARLPESSGQAKIIAVFKSCEFTDATQRTSPYERPTTKT